MTGSLLVGFTIGATAQTVENKQWQGTTAMTRQPEQVVANTVAEWRSLWSRVGVSPPEPFDPVRMRAVGIFLGARPGEGYLVNVLSTNRRRDRVVIVFEERIPTEVLMAQRSAGPVSRPISGGLGPAGTSFAPSGGAPASLPPMPARPPARATSPWAIVLINRGDLPVSVEQRLFR